MKKKSLIVLIMALVALLIIPMTASAHEYGWVDNGDGTFSFSIGGDQLAVNTTIFYEDEIYGFDENGIMLKNTWYQFYGDWYYFTADGKGLRNGMHQVGSDYYYFAPAGTVSIDTQFSFNGGYNENGDWVVGDVYRAKENGALYRNEWYCDSYGHWYYYGSDCKAPCGLANVGGVNYCFDAWGRWIEFGTATIYTFGDTIHYIIDSDGGVTQGYNNNWIQTVDGWHYIQNDEFCAGGIYTIGGVKYAFDWSRIMYEDDMIYMNVNGDYGYIYATANGTLAANEWVLYNNSWHYFGADHIAVTGVQTIGGKTYIFDDWGEAYENTIYETGGHVYVIGEDCVAVEVDGWFKFNDYWFYEQDGAMLYDGIFEIGGKLWAFEEDGRLADADDIYYDEYNGYYYLIADDQSIETNAGWQKSFAGWVYVTEDTYLYDGYLTLGTNTYCMTPVMNYCTLIMDGDYLYNVGTDGVIHQVTQDGLYYVSARMCVCVDNGKLVREDWYTTNGNDYYFDYYGHMVKDCSYAIYNPETDDYDCYFFDFNGKLWTNGWVRDSYGCWYWADASNGGKLFTGIDSAGYLFDGYGQLLTSYMGYCYDDYYVTNSEGVIIGTLNEGWNDFGGERYLFIDGYVVTGSYSYEGKRYFFDHDTGAMATNELNGMYYYGADGAVVTGWIELNGNWYYGDPDDEGCFYFDGEYTIDGKRFYFVETVLAVNSTVSDADKVYVTNYNGEIINEYKANGWTYDGKGNAFYAVNGTPYSGWLGDYFLSYGRFAVGQTVLDNGKTYYIDNYGHCVYNGWYNIWGDKWIYARADGSLYVNEWLEYGGKWYYFEDYYMAYSGVYEIEGVEHRFDKNGVWLGSISQTDYADGWVQANGNWYYYMAGYAVRDQFVYYNGDWYFLGHDGVMVTNSFNYNDYYYYYGNMFYFGGDGKLVKYTGWHIIDGQWCYFGDDYSVTEGWIYDGYNYYYQVSGYDYLTDTDTFGMVTGYLVDNGVLCEFNPNGSFKQVCTATGWYGSNGQWYYVENGKPVVGKGMYKIGNTYYAFDYDGVMVEYGAFDDFYYGADGALATTGWYYLNNAYQSGWVYVTKYGELAVNGVYLIDGVEYYFDGGIMV